MSGRLQTAFLAAALGAALLLPAAPAAAERFTFHLDDLEIEVADRLAAMPEVPATREEKKEKAAYVKVLAALAGDTESLLEELKLAARVAKTLEKVLPADQEILDLLDAAADGLEEDVVAEVGALEEEIDAEPDSSAKVRMVTKLDVIAAILEESVLEELRSLRFKALQKALTKTKPVVKFLASASGGGGGGGGCYEGTRTLAAGESCTAAWEGGSFTASAVKVSLPTAEGGGSYGFEYWQCLGGTNRAFAIYSYYEPIAPETGVAYEYGSTSFLGVYRMEQEGGGFTQVIFGSGTVTFTEIDAATGTYAGTFTYSGGGLTGVTGSFRIVGAK